VIFIVFRLKGTIWGGVTNKSLADVEEITKSDETRPNVERFKK
jgi:hypothetical protein